MSQYYHETDRPLPSSQEMEQAVLGSILYDSQCLTNVRKVLQADDFYRADHRILYSRFLALFDSNTPIDLVTVSEDLRRQAALHENGDPTDFYTRIAGAVYLPILMDQCTTPASALHYALKVKEAAVCRSAIQRAGNIMERAYTGNVEFLREVEADLDFRAILKVSTSRPRPVVMSDVKSEKVSWLWHGWIPFGKLSILAGNPGLGKSNLMIDIASRVSRGRSMPFRELPTNEPAGVLILSAEDSLSDTIKPRLEAADADLTRIRAYRLDELPELSKVSNWLEQDIEESGASLVVIDPLMAFVPGNVDFYKDQHIRTLLSPVSAVAERTGAAIVFIHHLNKTSGGPALYRASGSIGIVGAARSAMLLSFDPSDTTRRILAHMKGNLCRSPQSLRFHMEAADEEEHPHCIWDGIAQDQTADTLLQAPLDSSEERSQRANAEEFLRETLTEGPQSSKQLQDLAKDAGIARRTLERACVVLGVKTRRVGGMGADGHTERYLDQPETDT